MDTASNYRKQDSPWFATAKNGLVLFFFVSAMNDSNAQHLAIRSRDRSQEIKHDLIHEEQSFEEVRWDIHNSVAHQGVAVIWTAQPFELVSSVRRHGASADAGLALRILHSGPPNSWKIHTQCDATHVVAGDSAAIVSAVSDSHSEATFGVTVVFRGQRGAIPVSGQYHTMLTGTIAAL